MPIGRLIRKIIRHGSQWTITPPVSGPSSGPNSAGMITKFIARRMPDFGKVLSSAIRPTGIMKAAPIPCRTREATSIGRFADSPQASEPRVNTATAKPNTRRVPNLSASQPLSGISTAIAMV